MNKVELSFEDIAEIEAQAHALRAAATFSAVKTVGAWLRRQFSTSTPVSTQGA